MDAERDKKYQAGSYARLSREDGDKIESDSIVNQQHIIDDFCASKPEIGIMESYVDDGYTGTNFNRPGFLRMINDIESGKINCVIVKDLSRFGRDYIDMGFYLERFFPQKNVRFIAINDHVDSLYGAYDMMLPLKNVFNTQYAKDISEKVRSAFKAKQKRGEFVGAFASYGYLKDPQNHNHLIVDPIASEVVLRIFEMAAEGYGQIKIAKILNDEKIPCPSEYKRLIGENYTNTNRLDKTAYWTYSTIHSILKNECYRGHTVSNRYYRPTMHGKAKKTSQNDVIIVKNTHDAIISDKLWNSVQSIVSKNTRAIDFNSHVHTFAGLIKCGNCGRAMCRKTSAGNAAYFSCGSYERYGPSVCSKHSIRESILEKIILQDLNCIISEAGDLRRLAHENQTATTMKTHSNGEKNRLEDALKRIRRLKKKSYEDYCDELLSKDEYKQYKADYEEQESKLLLQLQKIDDSSKNNEKKNEWIGRLLELGRFESLDRVTMIQTVQEIRVFEDHRIEITYLFSEELGSLFDHSKNAENRQENK